MHQIIVSEIDFGIKKRLKNWRSNRGNVQNLAIANFNLAWSFNRREMLNVSNLRSDMMEAPESGYQWKVGDWAVLATKACECRWLSWAREQRFVEMHGTMARRMKIIVAERVLRRDHSWIDKQIMQLMSFDYWLNLLTPKKIIFQVKLPKISRKGCCLCRRRQLYGGMKQINSVNFRGARS